MDEVNTRTELFRVIVHGNHSLNGMPIFNHEKLNVYQKSIEFVSWCDKFLNEESRNRHVTKKLNTSSTSIPNNIAEGNGKTYKRERARYFSIAFQSAQVCASCLDIFEWKGEANENTVYRGKKQLYDIVCMLSGLINGSQDHVSDSIAEYGDGDRFDHEKLDVYDESLNFISAICSILKDSEIRATNKNQLDRASISIVTNIAMATAKYTGKGRKKCLQDAKGSALECSSNLDVLMAKAKISDEKGLEGKKILQRIVGMIQKWLQTVSE